MMLEEVKDKKSIDPFESNFNEEFLGTAASKIGESNSKVKLNTQMQK